MKKRYSCLLVATILSTGNLVFADPQPTTDMGMTGLYAATAIGAGGGFLGHAPNVYGWPKYAGGPTYQFATGYLWRAKPRLLSGVEVNYTKYSNTIENGFNTTTVNPLWPLPATKTVTDTSSATSLTDTHSVSLLGVLNLFPDKRNTKLYVTTKFGIAWMSQHFIQSGYIKSTYPNIPSVPTITDLNINSKTTNLPMLTGAFGIGYYFTPRLALFSEFTLVNAQELFKTTVEPGHIPMWSWLTGLRYQIS